MHKFKLQITSVKDDGNEMFDANCVNFDVIAGTPTAAEVASLIELSSNSVCNIDYNDEVRAGCFIDLNFEYSVGQVLTNTQTGLHESQRSKALTIIENETKLKGVPKLSAVVVKDKPKHLRHLVRGAIIGTVMSCFLYLYLTSERFQFSPFGLDTILSLSIFFAFGALLISYSAEHLALRQDEYKEMLKGYNQGELFKLSKSSELNELEQKLVVEFLNETYPGWSLVDIN